MTRNLLLAATLLATAACAQESVTTSTTTSTPATQVESAQAAPSPTASTAADTVSLDAPDSAYRTLVPSNVLVIDTVHGRMIGELYPQMAPGHVERVQTLAGIGFYDGLLFHRVIDGFMNQTGDPRGDGTGDSGMDDLPAEFTFRRSPDMGVALVGTTQGARAVGGGSMATGFMGAMPVATQPSSQALLTQDGAVEAYGLHCPGVLSMARAGDPNSANSQFFVMRGAAPFLDAQYTVWGTLVAGHEVAQRIAVTASSGPGGESPIPGVEKDRIEDAFILSSLPEDERFGVQVLDTSSQAFADYLDGLAAGGAYPDICDVEVPSRIVPTRG